MKRFKGAVAVLFLVLLMLGTGQAILLSYSHMNQARLNSALQKAITVGDSTTALRLMEEGAKVDNIDPGGETSLMHAARQGNEEEVRLLLDCSANVHLRDFVGITALYLAAEYGYPQIVQLLLSKGANPNVKTRRGHTVLDVAESAHRVRSRSANQTRPPLIADFDRVIRLLHTVGATHGARQ